MADWFVFEHTVEALFFKALASRITPSLAARLKELGIDVRGKPRNVAHKPWVQALKLASELFEGTEDERFRQLGHAVLLRHEETLTGRALIAVLRMLGPRRVMGLINTTQRSGNNYIQASFAPASPTSWEGQVNECNGNPHYIAGVVEQGLRISGAKNPQVLVSGFDGHAATFQISWG